MTAHRALGLSAVIAACSLTPLDHYDSQNGSSDIDAGDATSGEGAAPDVAQDALPLDDGGAPDVDAGPGAPWTRYSLDTSSAAGAPWTVTPLEQLWTGPSAPPPRGVVAAVQLVDFSRLLVITGDGTLYVQQDGGVWMSPMAITAAFPQITGPVDGITHIPYAFAVTLQPDAALVESLLLQKVPQYWYYQYLPNDQRVFERTGTTVDVPPPGAPEGTGKLLANFEILDLGNADAAVHFRRFDVYGDGNVYSFDAAATWTKTPLGAHPFWSGRAGAPALGSIRATYYDQGSTTLHVIGP